MKKHLLALFCCVVSSVTSARADGAKTSLPRFRFAPLAAVGNGSYDLSSIASWNPEYRWNDTFGVGLNAGYSLLKRDPRPYFHVLEASVSGSYAFRPFWTAELFLGAQRWFVSGGRTAFLVGFNGKYTLPEKWLGCVDGFFAGYSFVTHRPVFHIVRAGATFQF